MKFDTLAPMRPDDMVRKGRLDPVKYCGTANNTPLVCVPFRREFSFFRGDYDSLWDQSPGVYGASKTLSVCQKTSFGILRFNKELDYFRNILGHHVGHLLGLYHDGEWSCRRLVNINASC